MRRLKGVCLALLLVTAAASASGPPRPPSVAPASERPLLQHTARDSAPPGHPLEVRGTLSEGARFAQLYLRFRGPGGSYQEVQMEGARGTVQGAIPASAMSAPGVEYYVEGVTARGERVPLFRSADRPARVLVLSATPRPAEAGVRQQATPAPPTSGGAVSSASGQGGARKSPPQPAERGAVPSRETDATPPTPPR